MSERSNEIFDFNDDDCVEELQALVKAILAEVEKEKANGGVIKADVDVPTKTAQMQASYEVLRKITIGDNLSLDYVYHDGEGNGGVTTGYIAVEGDSVRFTNTALLAQIVEFTYTVDTVPLTSGRIHLDFCFM